MKPLFLLLLLSFPIFAQDHPKVELFGGYSYARADLEIDGLDLHGWNASVAGNVNKWFGIKADFGGLYKSASGSIVVQGVRVTGSETDKFHTFLFGPQFTHRTGRVNLFGHILAGAVRLDVDATGTVNGTPLNVNYTDTAFGLALGGGVDVKLTDKFWLRPAQVDYLLTRFGDTAQDNLRFSTGVVIRDK